jgi:hypothetical protein
VMSSRERAKPVLPRFAGRRRNMPSKSTIPALPTPLSRCPATRAPRALIRPSSRAQGMSVAQRNTPRCPVGRYRLAAGASTSPHRTIAQVIDIISVCLS